jgi:hypothetical protein
MFETLCFDFSYLDLICLDSNNFKEEISNYLVESASRELMLKNSGKMMAHIRLRLERAEKFIEYLNEQEAEEVHELNLDIGDIK